MMNLSKFLFLTLALGIIVTTPTHAEPQPHVDNTKPATMVSSSSYSHEFHVFVPGLQYRFENDQDQGISNRQYRNYNLAAIIFTRYLIGAEFDEYQQESSSGSIHIKAQFQEFNLYLGYLLYSKLLSAEYKVIFDIGSVAYIGQNRTTVETRLNSISQQSVGEDNLSYALGAQATLRAGFFIIQPEVRYAYSRSYEPSYVPVFGGRIGFRIGL